MISKTNIDQKNNDEILLKSLQDELTKLADKYDTLVTNLEGKENK